MDRYTKPSEKAFARKSRIFESGAEIGLIFPLAHQRLQRDHADSQAFKYWRSCAVKRLAKRSVFQFVRKGVITVGSSCQSVESRKVRDSESATVFSFPGTCCAEIKMFL